MMASRIPRVYNLPMRLLALLVVIAAMTGCRSRDASSRISSDDPDDALVCGCVPPPESRDECNRRPLAKADYYLALDLDETLLYQWHDSTFADLQNVVADDTPGEVHVKFAPHAE